MLASSINHHFWESRQFSLHWPSLLHYFSDLSLQLSLFSLFLSNLFELTLLYLIIFFQFCQSDVIFLKRSVEKSGCQIEAFLQVSAVLLCLEFNCLVEMVSQLEQTLGKSVGGFRLVFFDLLFGIGPDLVGFLDVFSESDSHLVDFVVSLFVEFLLFFKLK